jgi:hypothetical protein
MPRRLLAGKKPHVGKQLIKSHHKGALRLFSLPFYFTILSPKSKEKYEKTFLFLLKPLDRRGRGDYNKNIK